MSRNLELLSNGLAAFSDGDLDRSIAEMSPEIEWHVAFRLPDWPRDKYVAHGPEEVREIFEAFRSVWEQLTVEVEEVLYDEGDTLLVRVRFHGRGAGSGAEVDRVLYYVAEIRDERMRRLRPFDDLEAARKAAGLGDG